MKRFLILIIFLTGFNLQGQETPKTWKDYIDLGGYFKYLNTLNFHNTDDLLTDNLWHNRLNLKIYASESITFNAGLRTRLFFGDLIKNPFYRQGLATDEGIINLSTTLLDRQNMYLLTQVDRLNIDFNFQKWNISLGRQRINWGKNLVWNPNDIFNTANFLDIDYEEKPGNDALRIRYNIGDFSQLDAVYAPNADFDTRKSIFALAFHSMIKTYDYQLVFGKYHQDWLLGLGWEGQLSKLGFKGETSYFIKENNNILTASISLDYAFKNGTNWLFSTLYNGGFEDSPGALLNLLNTRLNVQNMFPSDWAFYNQFSGNFGPAWQWSAGAVYGVKHELFVLIPQITYSISDNWEIDFFGQSFFADIPNIKQRNIITFRLRYDF